MSDSKKTGDVVTSYNQSGGITAHTVNIGGQPELVPRSVSDSQLDAIRAAIAGVRPERLLVLTFDSRESQTYSRRFEAVLKEAGWTVEHLLLGSGRPGGPFMLGWNETTGKTAGYETLARGLSAAGIEVKEGEFSSSAPHAVSLDVGVLEMTAYQRAVDKVQ